MLYDAGTMLMPGRMFSDTRSLIEMERHPRCPGRWLGSDTRQE